MIQYYCIPGLKYRHRPSRTAEVVIQAVCYVTGVSNTDIFRRTRKGKITEARQIIFYLLRKKTTMRTADIGRLFNLDHSTIIHALRHVSDLIKTYEYIRNLIIEIENEIA